MSPEEVTGIMIAVIFFILILILIIAYICDDKDVCEKKIVEAYDGSYFNEVGKKMYKEIKEIIHKISNLRNYNVIEEIKSLLEKNGNYLVIDQILWDELTGIIYDLERYNLKETIDSIDTHISNIQTFFKQRKMKNQ